jgi:SAM-dependent methyltransferase
MNIREIHECTRRTYDTIAETYHALFSNELDEKPFDRAYLDRLSGMLSPGASICDAGCGPSAQAGRYLAEKQFTVFGLDISEQCIELARESAPGMTFICTDVLDWNHAPDSLDAIVAYYSIIYTPKKDVGRILDVFFEKLKPGGRLLAVVKKGAHDGFQDSVLGIPARHWWAEYHEDELTAALSASGFSVDDVTVRAPYEHEIEAQRIYCLCTKPRL